MQVNTELQGSLFKAYPQNRELYFISLHLQKDKVACMKVQYQ